MSRIWSKAFWKDAGERVLGTAVAGVGAALGIEAIPTHPNLPDLTLKQQAISIGLLCLGTLVKCLISGLASPNTGASMLGTAVPTDQVKASVDVPTGEVVNPETKRPVDVTPTP